MTTTFTVARPNGQPTVFANTMTEADIPSLAQALGTDKSIHDWTVCIPWPYSEAQARGYYYFCQDFAETQTALGGRQLVIRVGSADGPIVGGIGWDAEELMRDNETGKQETPYIQWAVGYWLVAAYRGQGILPLLVEEIKKSAEKDGRVARVQLVCFTDNLASRRVAEKAGFALEGTMKHSVVKHGKVKDQFLFSWIPAHKQSV